MESFQGRRFFIMNCFFQIRIKEFFNEIRIMSSDSREHLPVPLTPTPFRQISLLKWLCVLIVMRTFLHTLPNVGMGWGSNRPEGSGRSIKSIRNQRIRILMTISSKYSIFIPDDTLLRANKYLNELQLDRTLSGKRLQSLIQDEELKQFQSSDLLGKLFDTKIPQIFAESEVVGDGSDWNLIKLRLLGDISIAVPVTIYDDGKHNHPIQHHSPFSGMLVFTPGALLCNGQGLSPRFE